MWTIFSICCFCSQMMKPNTPKPAKASITTESTTFAHFLPLLRWVTASTFFRVSAMMNMVWPEGWPPDMTRAWAIFICASLASEAASPGGASSLCPGGGAP